jgi:antitoxin component of MazEF toxin-antitoxin module
MLKTITRVGNSQGLIFDAALCELTGLKAGDQVNITVHEGGAIVLTPIRKAAPAEAVSQTIRRTVKDYRKTLRKLA